MRSALVEKMLTPLSSALPTGEAIRYTALYDLIQEARRSEDETLPQGIWKTTIKKADWPLVASLCTQGLLEQSKDLQLAGWLTEAWVFLHGLEGLAEGLSLFQGLTEKFWTHLHPALDPSDASVRVAPFEWLDHQLPTALLHIFVTQTQQRDLKNFSFADWIAVQYLETNSKKQKDASSYIQKEIQKGTPQPALVRASLRSTAPLFYQNFCDTIDKILTQTERLEDFLKERLGAEAPLFYDLKKQLETLKRFATAAHQTVEKMAAESVSPLSVSKIPAENATEVAPSVSENEALPEKSSHAAPLIESREKAYAQLALITDFLAKTDPHSPTPYLLRRALSWQNRTLLDVFQDFRQDPHALQIFLLLLEGLAPRSG